MYVSSLDREDSNRIVYAILMYSGKFQDIQCR